MQIRSYLTLALATVAFSACDRADPIEPYAPIAPRLTVAGATLGSMIVPTLPTNDPAAYGEVTFQPTGIVIPDSAEVEVKVSGLLHATTNPAWRTAYCESAIVGGHPWACSPASRTNFDLTWKGNSDSQLMVKVGVRGADGRVRTIGLSQRAGQDPNVGYATISIPGQLMVARTGIGLVFGPTQDMNGNTVPAMGALKLESDQQLRAVITADWRQPSLSVKCIPARLPRGNNTICTASAQPTGASFVVQKFTFAGDSGAVASQEGDLKSWPFAPPQSGTVTVNATVGGKDLTATARVEVVCNFFAAPTGDSILDDVDVQALLHRRWRESKASGPESERIERGAYVMQRNGQRKGVDWVGPADRCNADPGTIQYPSTDTVVASLHTHPDRSGPVPTDGTCKGNSIPGRLFGDGPSPDEDEPASDHLNARLGRKVPSYIIDRDHVHRYGDGFRTRRPFNRNRSCTL